MNRTQVVNKITGHKAFRENMESKNCVPFQNILKLENKMSGVLAFAMYKPKEGLESELETVVKQHLNKLLDLQLITDKNSFSGQSTDGTIIEIFQWASLEAKRIAHDHPEVAFLWDRISAICEFPAMKDLPESHSPFPNFGAL